MIAGEKAIKTAQTILIVEDEGIIAMHLRRMLSGFGFSVPATAATGPDALQCVEQFHPDLVLMDIQLQGEMDGIETARSIHARHDTPIIYLTAFAEDSRLALARATGPYGYLIKPVQDRELRATIEMALFKHKLDLQLKESESSYRELYHSTPAMFHTTDPGGNIIQVSDYWLATLGYTREEVIGRQMVDFTVADSRKYMLEVVGPELSHTGVVRDAECRLVCKNGRLLDIVFSTVSVYDSDGELMRSHSALVDITARKRAETAERDQRSLAEALRDTASALSSTLSFEEVLERVLTNVGKVVPHDAVNLMLVDDDVAHVARSQGYYELNGGMVAGATVWRVSEHPALRAMAEAGDSLVVAEATSALGWGMDWIRSYAGAPIIVKGRLVGFINLMGLRAGFFNSEHASRLRAFADQVAVAIENARLYAEVERLATLDEVTGIFNRRRLFELGQREFDLSRRYSSPLSAILIDLDLFKKINDTYGHHAGDHVLAGIAATIASCVRGIDVFGRYGGEEFVLLLPQSNLDAALEVSERLRMRIEAQRFETKRGVIQVTISLGIACLTDEIPSLATLIDRADQAMYAAKRAGRNRVEVYKGNS